MIFNNYSGAAFAVGNNQTVIAAPGANRSIFLQYIFIANKGLAAGAGLDATFKDSGGQVIGFMALLGTTQILDHLIFPGGLELRTNTSLLVDVSTNPVNISLGWAIGAT